jgi:hypothetical protein
MPPMRKRRRSMGLRLSLAIFGLVFYVLGSAGAYADHAPVYVVPGRPGVPVIINGYDASYTVVEGDWGLTRPGHRPPTIVSGPLITPAPYLSGPYFPSMGRRPGYGRVEIEPPPNRQLPPPAPGFYREWGTQSPELPATIDPPADPPPVILAPTIELPDRRSQQTDRRWRQPDRRWHQQMRRSHRFTPHGRS